MPVYLNKSSLYYYVKNHCHSTAIATPERQACILPLPVTQAPDRIFHRHVLLEHHLSIDQIVSRKDSALSPSHYTATYQNESSKLIVHVYFDHMGRFNGAMQIKQYDLALVADPGIHIDVEPHLTEKIKLSALPAQIMLLDLLQKKDELYWSFCERVAGKNNELASAFEQVKNKKLNPGVLNSLIDEYIALLEQLFCYSDVGDDGRIRFLMDLKERMKAPQSNQAAVLSVESASCEPESKKIVVSRSKVSKKKSPKKSGRVDFLSIKASITQLIDEINLIDQNPDENEIVLLLESSALLIKLKDALVIGEFEARTEMERLFVQEQHKRIPKRFLVDQEFPVALMAGDVEYVRHWLPMVQNNGAIKRWCLDLIDLIENKEDSIVQPYIDIADFLYEHLEIYRMCLTYRSMRFSFDPGMSTGLSPLIRLFRDNKLSAFNMFLRQGVSVDSAHFIQDGYRFNALQALLIFYRYNPNHAFISVMIEAKVSTQFHTEKIASFDIFVPKKSSSSLGFFANKKTIHPIAHSNSSLPGLYEELSQTKTALRLAVRLYFDTQPSLILSFAESADMVSLTLITVKLLLSQKFVMRYAVSQTPSHVDEMLFLNKEACDEYLTASLSDVSCYELHPWFYGSSDLDPTFFRLAQNLLSIFFQKHMSLSTNEKKHVINALNNEGLNQCEDHLKAGQCFVAAYFVNSLLITHDQDDHNLAIKLLKRWAKSVHHRLSGVNDYITQETCRLEKYYNPSTQTYPYDPSGVVFSTRLIDAIMPSFVMT